LLDTSASTCTPAACLGCCSCEQLALKWPGNPQ
jgi:hypothetical protein